MGWVWREVGGWDSASIFSSDMAYFRNSISRVRLRAGSIDVERVMMGTYALVLRSNNLQGMGGVKMQMFFFMNAHVCLSSVCSNSANPQTNCYKPSLLVKLNWNIFWNFVMDVPHLLIYTRWSLSMSHHAVLLYCLFPKCCRTSPNATEDADYSWSIFTGFKPTQQRISYFVKFSFIIHELHWRD